MLQKSNNVSERKIVQNSAFGIYNIKGIPKMVCINFAKIPYDILDACSSFFCQFQSISFVFF